MIAGVLAAAAGVGYARAARRGGSAGGSRAASSFGAAFDAVDLFRPHRFLYLCLSYLAFGFAYITYATFIVASLESRLAPSAAVAGITLLWGTHGVASIVGAFATASLLDGPLRRTALTVSGLSGAIGCFVTFASPSVAVAGALLVGLNLAATPAAATAYARDRTSAAGAAGAIAAVTVAVGLGQLAGPVVSGVIADRFGPDSVAFVAGCRYLIATALALADALVAQRSR